MATLEVHDGDITQLKVDAIVNAANSQLAGGGGVDGAIHRAAGTEQLQAACRSLNGCPTGSAKVTPGFNLPATWIFHAVGPVWQGGGFNEDVLLASCYETCMLLATKHACKSIAFPAISCGVYGYPIPQAAQIAVDTVRGTLLEAPCLERVVFCCFGSEIAGAYEQML
ncbi:MAG: O-acetyl-ADP-ribose deacetylase [Cellvibrionaceae bacterium]